MSTKPALTPSPAAVDMKFEIVVIPVSDIDRAKEFYQRLGWRSTPTSPPTTKIFASFSSPRPARVVR